MKIVGICKPFNPIFNFMVYDDENILVTEFSCSFDSLNELVLTTAKQNKIEKVVLIGPQNYTKKIKDNIKELESSKYEENKITIELI